MKKIDIGSTKRNKILVIYLLIELLLMIFWGIFIFWLIKMDLIWNPLQFWFIFSILIILIIIPAYFFSKSLIILIKNVKLKEKITFSKPYLAVSALIFIFIISLSFLAFFYYFFPSASVFYREDDGPYLIWNDNPETTITIIWLTKNPSQTELEYGRDPNDMETYKDSFNVNQHIVPLTELKSGTKYYYKIPGFSEETYWFKTAPEGSENFNFSAISDTHAAYSDSKYDKVIGAMEGYDYEFIVHAGDAMGGAGGNLPEWHTFFETMTEHAATHPYMIALGNHEYSGDLFGRNFKYFFPYDYEEDWGHYYSFDYSNAHFVMIDVFQNQLDWGGFITEAQEAWLRRDLE
ncbi:MAG: metallophosphoesterase family protein, partial [Promethearchaeota archaeon]